MPHQTISFIKILLLIFSLSHGNSLLLAQKFRGGLKAGLVASEVSGDNLAGPDKTGFYAGTFANYPVSEYQALQLEIMYIQKGSRSKPTRTNGFYDYRFSLHYMEIPVLFIQDFAQFTTISYIERLSAQAGLSASFLVDHHESNNGYSITNPDRENFHTAELNLMLGLSYPIGKSIFLNLGFSNSLTPVRPHESHVNTWNNYGQYNTLWTAGLSYIFW